MLEELAQDLAEENRLYFHQTSAKDNVNVTQVNVNKHLYSYDETCIVCFYKTKKNLQIFNILSFYLFSCITYCNSCIPYYQVNYFQIV